MLQSYKIMQFGCSFSTETLLQTFSHWIVYHFQEITSTKKHHSNIVITGPLPLSPREKTTPSLLDNSVLCWLRSKVLIWIAYYACFLIWRNVHDQMRFLKLGWVRLHLKKSSIRLGGTSRLCLFLVDNYCPHILELIIYCFHNIEFRLLKGIV